MVKYKKCKLTKNSLKICETLQRALEDSWNKKGLSCLPTFNMKKGMQEKTYYIVKSGDFLKKGIVLNYCPFCGEKIYDYEKKDEVEK